MLKFRDPGIRDFFGTFDIKSFAVSDDESQLVFCSSLNGTYHLWGLDPASPFPVQLTSENKRSDAIVFHSGMDGRAPFILYTGDAGGDENMQIYAVPPSGGEPLRIRTAEGKRHFFGHLSDDGLRLYYSSNKERPMYLNSYRYDIETGEEEILLEGSGAATYLSAVSPSETVFAYTKMYARTNIPAFIQRDGFLTSVVPDDNLESITYQMHFVTDDMLYLLTNYQSEFSYLATYCVSTNEFKRVVSIPREEIRCMAQDPSTGFLYLISSHGVNDYLYSYNPETAELVKQTTPVDNIAQLTISKSGNVYLLGTSATLPMNIFRRVDSEWTMLTRNQPRGLGESDLTSPKVLHYPSFDGQSIEAVYYPANPNTQNGHTIIWPHGGPQHNEQLVFNSMFQYFCHLGYNVFMPNFRGSMYYGDHFHRMVERDWGGGPRLDVVAGAEWMVSNGLAEAGKLIVVGGSYGGYMTLLLLGQHGELFKAGVDLFGVCNLLTLIDSVPDYWKPRMEKWVGHPVNDRAKLMEQSPITYADRINKPLMIYHGANDSRVAKEESDQIVAALHRRGVDVHYVVFEDEGHSSFTKINELQMFQEITEFLARLL